MRAGHRCLHDGEHVQRAGYHSVEWLETDKIAHCAATPMDYHRQPLSIWPGPRLLCTSMRSMYLAKLIICIISKGLLLFPSICCVFLVHSVYSLDDNKMCCSICNKNNQAHEKTLCFEKVQLALQHNIQYSRLFLWLCVSARIHKPGSHQCASIIAKDNGNASEMMLDVHADPPENLIAAERALAHNVN